MKEKRTWRLGHTRTPNPLPLHGSVIPEPRTPNPYIVTAFFTVIFVNTPLNPYLATGFKTRKSNVNAILRRFRSKRARTANEQTEQTMPLMNGSPMPAAPFGTEMAEAFE